MAARISWIGRTHDHYCGSLESKCYMPRSCVVRDEEGSPLYKADQEVEGGNFINKIDWLMSHQFFNRSGNSLLSWSGHNENLACVFLDEPVSNLGKILSLPEFGRHEGSTWRHSHIFPSPIYSML